MIAHRKDHLHQSQNIMKQQVDQNHSEQSFQVGDQVFLRIQPYKKNSLKEKGCQKLAPKLHGPCQEIQCIGAVAYKLALPTNSKIHPIFHVSCLKKVVGNKSAIIGKIRLTLAPTQAGPQYSWNTSMWPHDQGIPHQVENTSPKDVTWEPTTIFRNFHKFSL